MMPALMLGAVSCTDYQDDIDKLTAELFEFDVLYSLFQFFDLSDIYETSTAFPLYTKSFIMQLISSKLSLLLL